MDRIEELEAEVARLTEDNRVLTTALAVLSAERKRHWRPPLRPYRQAPSDVDELLPLRR